VRATLDGLPISWGTMASLMDHGGAIPAALAPYQNLPGFRFESHGLGIFSASVTTYLGATVKYGNGQEYDVTNKTVFEGGEKVTRWWQVTDFSFSFGSAFQTTQTTNPDPVKPENLKANLTTRLDANNGKCRDFINKVLAALGNKGDLANIDNIFARITDFIVDQNLTALARATSDGKGNRTVTFNPPVGYTNATATTQQKEFIQGKYISNLLHELLHHANPDKNAKITYGHSKIAEKMKVVLDDADSTEIEKQIGVEWKKIKKDSSDGGLSSTFMNMALNKTCPQ
jgi:hypothetical protein